MSSIKKRPTYSTCQENKSTTSRKRSIYSKIGASNNKERKRCNLVDKGKIRRNCSEADSLVSHLRLTCSTAPIVRPCNCHGKELHELTLGQDLTTYLKAFALIYVLPEEEWTAEYIDKLLLEGEQLFQTTCSEDDDHADGPEHQANIGDSPEQPIKRNFKLEGHNFTLELKSPYKGEKKKPSSQRPQHIIRNLKPVLQEFFRSAHYCMLLTKAGYLLIWRRRKVYFVMDVKGRRREDLVSVRHGVAMLICLQSIDKVVHLITQLSPVSYTDKFYIRELAVVRLVTPNGRVFMRESDSQPVEYKVINQNYAYLTSHLHLSLNPDKKLRNRSSVVVAVAAILASKIEHPASWSTSMFDRLICYGVEICRSCWTDKRVSIDLSNFPSQLRLGQFVVELKLGSNVFTGLWRYSDDIQKDNKLEREIQQTLKAHCNALFQINSQTYAMWVKENFYYLLDPYRHTVVTPLKPGGNGIVSGKWSTVRMFRDILTMLSVFHQLLKESNRQSPYSIHVVHIKNIKKCPQGYSLKPLPDDASYDVKSLNEKIKFPEKINNNENLLKQLSDDEPDESSEQEEHKLKPLVEKVKNNEKIKKVEHTMPKVKSTFTKPPKVTPTLLKDRSFIELDIPNRQQNKSSVLTIEQEETSSMLNKFSLQIMNKEKFTNKSTYVKIPNHAPTRCASPIFKPLAAGVIIKPDIKPPSAEPKIPKIKSQVPITTVIKPLIPKSIFSGTKTTKKCQNLYDKYRNKNGESAPGTNSIHASSVATRRKGVWNAKATDNLSALRIVQKTILGNKNALNSKNIDKLKQVNKKKLKILSSQTSFQSAQLPHDFSSVTDRIALPSKEVSYPVYTKYPHVLAVAGSESGTMESLKRLLDYSFKVSNRVLTMTPWGNYVVFRYCHLFYLFDGCTCNIDRFRHLDLSYGTAGLLPFKTKGQVICYMIDSRELRASKMLHSTLDDSCNQFEEFLGRSA
ncbi:uncharacterized protein LOC117567651 [Drosophila albomicans]|uniref:Uncharacterized protein LOC117567651 n=1 Tax=Drosophila albomicans TaxID=7291 RepID=A0A6P8WLH0_DROAB|nr:uncharacterized protein LOC117567651 [Drosophila albomicans]